MNKKNELEVEVIVLISKGHKNEAIKKLQELRNISANWVCIITYLLKNCWAKEEVLGTKQPDLY